jgi:hypothetical protein
MAGGRAESRQRAGFQLDGRRPHAGPRLHFGGWSAQAGALHISPIAWGGCCDSSKNKHATRHFHRMKHPVVRSIEPGESWIWCCKDQEIGGEV